MTESVLDLPVSAPGVVAVREHPDLVRLQGMLEELAEVTGDPGQVGPMADGHRIEELRRLEEIKAAAAAAQVRVTVAFETSQMARHEAAGVRREQRGRGSATRSPWPAVSRPHREPGIWDSRRR